MERVVVRMWVKLGKQKGAASVKTISRFLIYSELPYDPAIPLLVYISQSTENGFKLILVHQCSQQHSSQGSKGGSSPHVRQLMNGWPDVL